MNSRGSETGLCGKRTQTLLYLEGLSQKGAVSGGKEPELWGSCPSIQLSSSLRQKRGMRGAVSVMADVGTGRLGGGY